MIYRFDKFELDIEKCELRRDGEVVKIEPQVFSLLHLLVENHDRIISKEEMIEKIWDGRFISDAAVSSRIRSVRKALGDGVKTQQFIRTLYKQGVRFQHLPVLLAQPSVADTAEVVSEKTSNSKLSKPSIAVLPFAALGDLGNFKAVPDAFPHDLITALSKMRWLSVIARGSSFKFRGYDQDIAEIGKILGVSYCLSGSVELSRQKITLNLELARTKDGTLVWGERFIADTKDVFELREKVLNRCLVELELQISRNEATIADTKPEPTLDAWSAYHAGLELYYRFNANDNQKSLSLFEQASRLDKNFCRAQAGISSAYFQQAFYRYDKQNDVNIDSCRASAMRAIELDSLDPFANFAMGRVYWLTYEIEESAKWFEHATSLSPSYSHGHYACSWTQIVLGNSTAALKHSEQAMLLSPLDPLLASMQWIKACALLDIGQVQGAVEWSDRAARSPRSTIVMPLLAVVTNYKAGNLTAAEFWAEQMRKRDPEMKRSDIFRMMPFQNRKLRNQIEAGLEKFGF